MLSDYLHIVTSWLKLHSYWALFFTFAISFTESLAVIGSIIPGSVTMTAVGILAGSGVMRVDLTLIFATLGAIAGDGASYLIGYYYRERLSSMWPFRKYPSWLNYGKDYFSKHGGKSVFIGRFVGPLRSIIPVIAGMMEMSHWRFFVANALSAIGWAVGHIIPGMLIGAASSELSPESATRLFIVVLIFLGVLWLLSVVVRSLLRRIQYFFRVRVNDIWLESKKEGFWAKFLRYLMPQGENTPSQTVSLCIISLICLFIFLFLTLWVNYPHLTTWINQPSYLFLQSLRISSFDVFFIVCNGLISPISLVTLAMFIFLTTLFYRDWHSLFYWLSLNLVTLAVIYLAHLLINSPPPESFSEGGNVYPAAQLTWATAQFSALLFYLITYKPRYTQIVHFFLLFILIITGIGLLYLGDNWVTNILGAYAGGLSISLLHWIMYRRKQPVLYPLAFFPLLFLTYFSATAVSLFYNFEYEKQSHKTYHAEYLINEENWWQQNGSLLPIYRTNRIGKRISLFNIQYVGDLEHLERALYAYGWHKQTESLLESLVSRLNNRLSVKDAPLLAQLYLNKKPALIMVYYPLQGSSPQILRLWRSNYYLKNLHAPIWLGTVNPYVFFKKNPVPKLNSHSLRYISNALPQFALRHIPLKLTLPHQIPYPYEPKLLLIKEVFPWNKQIFY